MFLGEPHSNKERKEKKLSNLIGENFTWVETEEGKERIERVIGGNVARFLDFHREMEFAPEANAEKLVKKSKENKLKTDIKRAEILNCFTEVFLSSNISKVQFDVEINKAVREYVHKNGELKLNENEEIQATAKKGAYAVAEYVKRVIEENKSGKLEFKVNPQFDVCYGIDVFTIRRHSDKLVDVDLVQVKSGNLTDEQIEEYHRRHQEWWNASVNDREIFYIEERDMNYPEEIYAEMKPKFECIITEIKKGMPEEELREYVKIIFEETEQFANLPFSQKIGILSKFLNAFTYLNIQKESYELFKNVMKEFINEYGKWKEKVGNVRSVVKMSGGVSERNIII